MHTLPVEIVSNFLRIFEETSPQADALGTTSATAVSVLTSEEKQFPEEIGYG